MTPRSSHLTKISVLAATLWVIYLIPWPLPGFGEPLKPTLCAVCFALVAYRLGVSSWPLVIAFCLTFFIEGVLEVYANSDEMKHSSAGRQAVALYLWAVIFSPISLWGPVVGGTLAYAIVRRGRSR